MDEQNSGRLPAEVGGLRKWWLPGCMVVIFLALLVIVGGTWLAGGFKKPDLSTFDAKNSASLGNSGAPAANSGSATTTPGAPAEPGDAAGAPGGTLPTDNPLWGVWENRAALTNECPQQVALLESEVHLRATAADAMKTTPARYTIQGNDVVVTTAAGAATARVDGGQMKLGNCSYTRPYIGQ